MGVVGLPAALLYGGYIALLIVAVVGRLDGLCFVAGGPGDQLAFGVPGEDLFVAVGINDDLGQADIVIEVLNDVAFGIGGFADQPLLVVFPAPGVAFGVQKADRTVLEVIQLGKAAPGSV